MNTARNRQKSRLLPSELSEHVECGLREVLRMEPEPSDEELRRAAVDIGSAAVVAISRQLSDLDETREVLHLYMCALLDDRTAQIIGNARIGAEPRSAVQVN